jgi:hypothetical protein
MATPRGKSAGTPVRLGSAPGRSDRLASAVRLVPVAQRDTGQAQSWEGFYSATQTDSPDIPGAPPQT